MTTKEIWKDIKGYEGLYQISNFGRVKSLEKKRWIKRNESYGIYKEKILKKGLSGAGYYSVILYKNSKSKTYRIANLLADNFIEDIKKGSVVDHINNIKTDDRLENLQIITQRENTVKYHESIKKLPIGVSWNKRQQKYESRIWIVDKKRFLGLFNCPIKAGIAYQDELARVGGVL